MLLSSLSPVITHLAAPDKRAVEEELLARETRETEEPGLVKFVANGLQLQIEQCVFKSLTIGQERLIQARLSWQAFEKNNMPLSATNKKKLTSARSGLKTRIAKHNKQAIELLGPREEDLAQPEDDGLFGAGVILPPEWETGSSRAARDRSYREPEFYGVDLPSSRAMPLTTAVLIRAGAYELSLRVAWMAHLLHEICLSLVVQVEIFRCTIKRTPGSRPMTQREKTVTLQNMREQYQSVRVYANQYNVFRERMNSISAAPAWQAAHAEYAADAAVTRQLEFKQLEADHIRCDTKAYDTLGPGQFSMPWFWKLTARQKDIDDETFVQDCAFTVPVFVLI